MKETTMFRAAWLLVITALVLALAAVFTAAPDGKAEPAKPLPVRHLEKLGRGVVALHQGEGKVFVSWRLLGTDPGDVAFHLYPASGDAEPVRLTKAPLTKATCFEDTGVEFSKPVRYFVRAVIDGKEGDASGAWTLPANAPARPYLSIPLKTLPGHTPNITPLGFSGR